MGKSIVFMGSPDFAVPTLEFLAGNFAIMGVVTQPDRPAGRGKVLTPPPVKISALKYGLEIIQPTRLRDPGVFEKLQEWNPDAIIVAAFGQILRENVLNLPPYGCINVHASLLPRWRGAAPIQAAILSGDEVTGITIMQMDAGIDTGRIFSQKELPIKENETGIELGNRLAKLGAELLGETLPRIITGQLPTFPQDDSLATYAPKIEKSMGELDFSHSSAQLLRNIRAFHPWPGTQFNLDGQVIKVIKARAVLPGILFPGKRGLHEGLPAIGTGDGDLVIEELQLAGKKPMTGKAFLQGFKHWEIR